MAINDISLTAGMRSNLVSLQGTVDLLNRTQERLSSGKKVNSAIDNPLSYFTAKTLNSRANDLAAYKDGMMEAVQTVKAANSGISAIESLINQAKAVAASAKSEATGGGAQVGYTIDFGNIAAGVTISVGGVTYEATSGVTSAAATEFYAGGLAAEDAAEFAAMLLTVGLSVSVDGASVTINSSSVAVDAGVYTSATTGFTATQINSNDNRASLAGQYDELMSQLTKVATDSSYKGVNFLAEDTLDVDFGGGSTLTVTGFDASAASLLGTSDTATLSWATNASIDTDITELDAALETLKSQASSMSSNLSIINVRQDWVKSMVNTLNAGADNLVNADMNEEGANMLMLQTRQSLGTTSLSLASQATQSVLRLFG